MSLSEARKKKTNISDSTYSKQELRRVWRKAKLLQKFIGHRLAIIPLEAFLQSFDVFILGLHEHLTKPQNVG